MNYFFIYIKGLCMGAADVVPGVSGGTIAFISGIYERLLQAISHVDMVFIKKLSRGEIKAAWTYLDGSFLTVLFLGILTSFLLLARVVLYFMEYHTELFWGGMAGLILASTILVWRQLKKWNWIYFLPLLLGAGSAYFISIATPSATPNDLWFIFLSGMIAICAMILPGISGSFILVLLQKYEYMMTAIKEIRIAEIVIFIAGCVVGLLSFARLLKYLFRAYHDITVMVMAGFMLGSLIKLWPWKTQIESGTFFKEVNVLPSEYTGDPKVLAVVVTFVLCCAFVMLLEYIALKKK
ncbi:MAG: DUF368 domain-containing protein [Candidatus Gracilibacteria bacterium]